MIDRKTYINALLDALPDVIPSEETAGQILDVVFSVPARALENGDAAELPGLGSIGLDRSRGGSCLNFRPEGAHIVCPLQ